MSTTMRYGGSCFRSYINRFLSADTIVPDPTNPQSFNRYSYTRNNPVNFTDPTGHIETACSYEGECGADIETIMAWGNYQTGNVKTNGQIVLDVFTWTVVSFANSAIELGTDGFSGQMRENFENDFLGSAFRYGADSIEVVGALMGLKMPAGPADELIELAADGAKVTNTGLSSADELTRALVNDIESAYPGHVSQVEIKIYGSDGLPATDFDIVTKNAVIEVKSGGGKGATSQHATQVSLSEYPVIVYGPSLKPSVVRGIERAGGLVTTDKGTLLSVIAPD